MSFLREMEKFQVMKVSSKRFVGFKIFYVDL